MEVSHVSERSKEMRGPKRIVEPTARAVSAAARNRERRRAVERAAHSSEMEGLTVSTAWRRDADDYVVGTIDSAEFVARARARYNLG